MGRTKKNPAEAQKRARRKPEQVIEEVENYLTLVKEAYSEKSVDDEAKLNAQVLLSGCAASISMLGGQAILKAEACKKADADVRSAKGTLTNNIDEWAENVLAAEAVLEQLEEELEDILYSIEKYKEWAQLFKI